MPLRTLSLDLSTKCCGWAMGAAYGAVELPGMGPAKKQKLGILFMAVRNAMCDLIEAHAPTGIAWCLVDYFDPEFVWEAHKAVRQVVELAAADHDVPTITGSTRTVRLAVLGRGDFGERDPLTGGLVARSGREQAKAAVATWCRDRGFPAVLPELGNALVLNAYLEMRREAPRGRTGRERLGHNHPGHDAREAASEGRTPG